MGISDRLPKETDVVVAGGGVLGICVAYWLSAIYEIRVAVVDASRGPAEHETYRNTGIIHRPFYLDPDKKRVFAQTSLLSHALWQDLAREWSLPWRPIGTLNVALTEKEVRTVERYRDWGLQNGMEEGELQLKPGTEVERTEPEVRCLAALLSKNDVSVDFRKFALQVLALAERRGVSFTGGFRVTGLVEGPRGTNAICEGRQGTSSIGCKLLVNAAGGGALGLAKSCGVGREFAQLNFRGEYWRVDEPFASRVTSNVYRPPKHSQFPFLDPHFVVRADGTRQIGPNAVLVSGPYAYQGVGLRSLKDFVEGPIGPKLEILTDGT